MNGILLLAFFLSLSSNLINLYFDYRKKSVFLMIWLLQIPFFYIPFLFYFFSSERISSESESLMLFSFICNLSYFIFLVVLRSSLNFRLTNSNPYMDYSSKSLNNLSLFLLFVFIALIFSVILISGGSILNAQRSILNNLIWYFSSVYGGVLAYQFFHQRKLFYVSLVLVFISILMFKSRGSLGFYFLPLAYLWIIRKPFTFRRFVVATTVGAITWLLVQVVKAYRWSSSGGDFDLVQFFGALSYNFQIMFTKGDLSLHRYSIAAFEACKERYFSCGEWSLIDKLIVSRFNGEEGISASYWIANYLNRNPDGELLSYHPISYGVAFFDGQWLGFLYFLFLTLFNLAISVASHTKYYFLVLGGASYLALFVARGSVYNSFMVFVFCLFFMSIVYLLAFNSSKNLNKNV